MKIFITITVFILIISFTGLFSSAEAMNRERFEGMRWFFGTPEEYILISSSEVARVYTDSSSSEVSR